MQVLKMIFDFIEKALDAVLVVMMIIMGSSIVIQVFSRYVLNRPTSWSEEIARYFFVWITMVGSAVVLRRRGHIDVSVLVDRLPNRLRLAVALLSDLAVLFFLGILCWAGIGITQVAHRQLSAATEVPMSFFYSALPVGAFFMILFLAVTMAREWVERVHGVREE